MTVFWFFALTFAAYRLQRIVTMDDWPPSLWFRGELEHRANEPNPTKPIYNEPGGNKRYARDAKRARRWGHVHKLFTCPWCFGFWVTVTVFIAARVGGVLELTFAQHVAATLAASAFVGLAGEWEGKE